MFTLFCRMLCAVDSNGLVLLMFTFVFRWGFGGYGRLVIWISLHLILKFHKLNTFSSSSPL